MKFLKNLYRKLFPKKLQAVSSDVRFKELPYDKLNDHCTKCGSDKHTRGECDSGWSTLTHSRENRIDRTLRSKPVKVPSITSGR